MFPEFKLIDLIIIIIVIAIISILGYEFIKWLVSFIHIY
jgi:Tfp pilus assembly protein PilE